jgi:hypothetical protein
MRGRLQLRAGPESMDPEGMVPPRSKVSSTGVFVEPLLAISREAHARGQHEVAYHALTSALHAAYDARDRGALSAVAQEAAGQIAWMDDHAPEHRLSTTSASGHNHPGVYALLARQANAYAHMLDTFPRVTDGVADRAADHPSRKA